MDRGILRAMSNTSFPTELEIQPLQHPINATVTVPGSKSYTNRALPIAALANGTSVLTGALFSDDTHYMTKALLELGFEIRSSEAENSFAVQGTNGIVPTDAAKVFIGNSGTTARFLTPLMALGHGIFELDGVPAMQKRPIQPLLDALNTLGARASSIFDTGCPPIRIEARGLRGGMVKMRGDLTSQVFSALLMSAPYFENGITLEVEGDLVSKPYLAVTAQTMKAFGAELEIDNFERFKVHPGAYTATNYAIEPDASAASYFFAAAAITGGRDRKSVV